MKQTYKRVCPVCGIKFEAKRKNQIYCSDKCRETRKYQQRRIPKHFDPIPCEQCGKMFTPRTSVNRFCSKKCCQSYFAKHTVKKTRSLSVCAWCGKPFERKYYGQKCCSTDCLKKRNMYRYTQITCAGKKLTNLGKVSVNRWHRLELSDGTRATNKKPWDVLMCAYTLSVPVEEVEKAFAEYDAAIKNGTEREFYRA